MIIAGTGHRPNKLGLEYKYDGPYSEHIRTHLRLILLKEKPEAVIDGLALGFDFLLAMIALELHIPLFSYIPFKGQERMWPTTSKNMYYDLLKHSNLIRICDVDKVVTYKGYQDSISTIFSNAKMHKRNEKMVDNTDEILTYFDGTNGGTSSCLKYAESKEKPIIYVPLFNP